MSLGRTSLGRASLGAAGGVVLPPGDPLGLSATVGLYDATLSWSAPTSGGPVDYYEARIDGGTEFVATSPHTFMGLALGSDHTLSVRAVATAGTSAWVDLDVTTLEHDPFGTPIDVGLVRRYVFVGLTKNSDYTVGVRALNGVGESSWVDVPVHTPRIDHPLRLEVEDDPPAGMLRNLLMNPSGELGGAGWITPDPGATLVGGTTLDYTTGTTLLPPTLTSEVVPVTPGQYVSARWHVVSVVGAYIVRFEFGKYDPAKFGGSFRRGSGGGYFVSVSTADVGHVASTATGADTMSAAVVVPADAVFARITFSLYADHDGAHAPAGNDMSVRSMGIVERASSGAVAFADVVDEVDWIDVLGPTHQVDVDRSEALNLGTLTATILDAELDPAVADTLSTGRACRLTALDADTSEWEALFTGRIDTAKVTYDTKRAALRPDDPKVARIALTAYDPAGVLARQPRPNGVGTVDELRDVLEGAGVPWIINGSSDQLAGAVVVSRNENASAVDQVGVTRDSRSAYAWVDRTGVLQAWDAAELSDDPDDAVLLDETAYSDLALSYDPDALINLVVVTYLTYDPATGESVETKYGPFFDSASFTKHGERRAEFTVHGLVAPDVDPTDAVADFAAAVLAANATAVRTCDSVTVPIRTAAEVTAERALLDQYQLVQVVNAGKDFDQLLRVTGVVHSISAERKRLKWDVTYTFDPLGSVASPQFTPPVPAKAPSGWTDVVFTNGWSNYGGTEQDVQYRKLGDRVEIRGVGAGGTPGTQVFQLPEGFRPPAARSWVQGSYATPSALTSYQLRVLANGAVGPLQGGESTVSVHLGCDFSTTE